jgi:ParB-like chromosome segregation protein Spo0J
MSDLKSIPEGTVTAVEISLLRNNPLNQEIYGDEEIDVDLLRSIQDHGVDTPIEVMSDGTIIKGHRRKLHAEKAGLMEVPVLVRHELNSPEEAGFALIEDNRHQRNRTNIQKVREIMYLTEMLQTQNRIRKATGLPVYEADALNDEELLELSGMSRENYEQVVELTRSYVARTGSSASPQDVACDHIGVSKKSFQQGQKALKTAEAWRSAGNNKKANQIEEALQIGISTGYSIAKKVGEPGKKSDKKKLIKKPASLGATILTLKSLVHTLHKVRPMLPESLHSQLDIVINHINSIRTELEKSQLDDNSG